MAYFKNIEFVLLNIHNTLKIGYKTLIVGKKKY